MLFLICVNHIKAQNFKLDTNAVYDFPVVVHVIHKGEKIGVGSNISNEEIYKMIERLNKYFRGKYEYKTNQFVTNLAIPLQDNKLQFHLVDRDEKCNYTTGINRVDGSKIQNYSTSGMNYGDQNQQNQLKDLSKWDPTKYINVWIVSEVYNGANAFANLPSPLGFNKYHGIVFGVEFLEDDLHEFSHFFGLTHTDMANYGFTSQGAVNIHRNSIQKFLYPLISNPVCQTNTSVDLAVLEVNDELKGYKCSGSVIPQVKIGNYGNQKVNDIAIALYKNKILQNTLNWKGELLANSSKWITLNTLNLAKGIDTFEISISTNGDNNSVNNEIKSVVKTVSYIGNSYSQNFENNDTKLSDFLIENNLYAKVSLSKLNGVNGSSAMMFEGDDNVPLFYFQTPSNTFDMNLTSISTASVCLDATNLSDLYFLYSKRIENAKNAINSNFRIRVDENQWTNTFRNIDGLPNYSRDTINLSCFKGKKIVLHMDASCKLSSKSQNYVLIDDIQVVTSPLVNTPLKLAFKSDRNLIYKGARVQYTDLTKGRYLPVKYKWIFNGASTFRVDTKMLPTFISYMDTGLFTSKLVTEDINGKLDSVVYKDYIKVVPLVSDLTFLNTQTEVLINDKDINDAKISVKVPKGTDLTKLVAKFTMFDGTSTKVNNVNQVNGVTENNFTTPVDFVFYTERIPGIGIDVYTYNVSVEYASDTSKNILSFGLDNPKSKGLIKGDSIYISLPYGTDVTALTPIFTSSIGSVIKVNNVLQTSGLTKNNFTNPIEYTVVAANQSIKKYIVKVKVAQKLASLETTQLENEILIYPNPNSGQFYVEAKKGKLEIIISDLLGREINTFSNYLVNDEKIMVEIPNPEINTYLIKVINNGFVSTHKLETY